MSKVGKTFGIYTVIAKTDKKTEKNNRLYKVRCNVCGQEIEVTDKVLRPSGRVHKCTHQTEFVNCIKNKVLREKFRGMWHRCYNVGDKDYHNYGGIGVYICDDWLNDPRKFEKWANRTGYIEGLTIDRVDRIGPYAPWNCRWLTKSENSRFTSRTNIFIVNGVLDTGAGWSRRLHVPKDRLNSCKRKYGKEFTERYIEDVKDGFMVLKPKIISNK